MPRLNPLRWPMGRLLAVTLAFALGTTVPALAGPTIYGRVVAVHDGDTLTVLDKYRRQFRIRLHLIDAPEHGQDFGASAKSSLSSLVFRREVTVEAVDTDRYHRIVGTVRLAGTDINLEQVTKGMAWVYRRYGDDPRYLAAEESARRSRRGLWVRANPVAPWDFRKEERVENHGRRPDASWWRSYR